MSRFLLTTWAGGGSVPPTLNLGVRLMRRGHEVLVVGWESMAGHVTAHGLGFTSYPSVPPWPDGLMLDDDYPRLDEMLHGVPTENDLCAIAGDFRPDVFVVDCMMAAAFRAAERLGTPSAVLAHLLYQLWSAQLEFITPGVSLDSATRILALVPPGFDLPGDLPPNTAYVGPIGHPDQPTLSGTGLAEVDEPGDPWVLLSLSTTPMGQAAALPPLLDALGSLPVRVLLTLGTVLPVTDLPSLPANVIARDYVPHAAVLPQMAAVVTHGGLSTITASLAAGVPLVVVPQGRDQSRNGDRVEATRVGRMVAKESPPDVLAAAIAEVLGDADARAAASAFARSISALGNGVVATDEVETLAR